MTVVAAAPTVEDVTRAIVRFLNTEIMAPAHPIAADDVLADAGVDSMALLKVLLHVEQQLDVTVPDEDLVDGTVASAATLARYLAGRLAA